MLCFPAIGSGLASLRRVSLCSVIPFLALRPACVASVFSFVSLLPLFSMGGILSFFQRCEEGGTDARERKQRRGTVVVVSLMDAWRGVCVSPDRNRTACSGQHNDNKHRRQRARIADARVADTSASSRVLCLRSGLRRWRSQCSDWGMQESQASCMSLM